VIDDLSRTLEAILTQPGLPPELSLANISFDSPAPPFAPTRTTVNLFLYDVQENLELRSNEPVIVRQGNRAVRKLPPMRVACSYLVTAWPVGGVQPALQEQLLLAQVLEALAACPTIPSRFLVDKLIGQEPLPPMSVAVADDLRNTAEFWTALGGRLRLALRVTATISVPVLADRPSFMVTAMSTRYASGLEAPDAAAIDHLVELGGRVVSAPGVGLAGAVVDVLDAGLRARTDQDGRFTFPMVPAGTRTFRAMATGFQSVEVSRPVPGRPDEYVFQLTP